MRIYVYLRNSLLRFSNTSVHPDMMNQKQHNLADIDQTSAGNLNQQNHSLKSKHKYQY